MAKSKINENTVREYLLGRVSDETMLETIEEKFFADDEFCSQVALAEDELINDYVRGRLNAMDAGSFQSTLARDSERRVKLELTQALRERALARDQQLAAARPSFFSSLTAFFRQPKYAGAFAVLLIGVLILAVYLTRQGTPDDLAELRAIYQQQRPTETRISSFDYAPLTQLRGAAEEREKNRLRRIENSLIQATEKKSNAQTHHALGVFYLTQQKYPEAIREFETALKSSDRSAQIHNDLGAVYFEMAKAAPKERRFEPLARALEEFTKALELDGNLLEALFNKSLALQELSPRQAKESWTLYLQKDPSSPWADEARRNLARIESGQALAKTGEQILADFLAAYRNKDEERAQRIHDETKGLLKEPAVALQLSRRFLTATQRGASTDAKESLEALAYIGRLEQTRNSEFFFLS